jgi:hypothetical protein
MAVNKRLNDGEVEAIRKRVEAATAGPWYNTRWDVATEPDCTTGYPSSPESICGTFDGEYIENPNGINDAEFIAHAREDVPKLLAEIERLKSVNYEAVGSIENICEMICIALSHGVSMDIGGIGTVLERIRAVLQND